MNRRVTLNQNDPDQDSPSHLNKIDRVDLRKQFTSLAEQVAESTVVLGNYKWPGADLAYPETTDAMMRFVDQYYPYATGGPLYVDTPRSARRVDRCEEKRKWMKKGKLRYVVIADGYMDPDGVWIEADNLSNILEQLE
jgi:hypothetical protein